MKTKRIKDKNSIIDFAREILANRNKYVILDTETTGLGENDVIVQIGVIDLNGNIILDTLIRPSKRKRISSEATAIHGISMKMLADSPTFKDIYKNFKDLIGNKTLLIYNAEYDARLIYQTAQQDGLKISDMNALCIMKAYSMFVGEWSDYHKSYKYQKLPSGDHSAIGDCKATLKVIEKMAACEKTELPKSWWQFWRN